MTDASNNENILSMCCNPNELDPDDTFCHRNGTVSVWSIFAWLLPNVSIALTSRELTCNGTIFNVQSYPPNNDLFYLMENGTMHVTRSVPNGTTVFVTGPSDYCFTSRLTDYGKIAVISVCNPMVGLEVTADVTALGPQLDFIAIGLSLPCLAATFFVYTIVPELKNVPGFILRAYAATLFVFNTFYLIYMKYPNLLCHYLLACLMYFTTLSHYFWLNVMCFDIWSTIRRVTSIQSQSKYGNQKRCIMYSIFAWGSALLMTVVAAIIDSIPNVPKGIIKSGFHEVCWFVDTIPATVYYIGPVCLTIVCNICFFVLTAITLIRHDKDVANRLNGSEEKLHNKEKKRFHLYLKLSIVMGIAWMAEVINWQWNDKLPLYAAAILDMPDALQGILIFVIFVWKPKTRKLLLKHLGRGEEKVSS